MTAVTSSEPSSKDGGRKKPSCDPFPRGLQGPLKVLKELPANVTLTVIKAENTAVEAGGQARPANCTARYKVALVVPYRNRLPQLVVFLKHMHPMLRRQELDYRIYVINQVGPEPFNRAMLLNVGFAEAMRDYQWDCFIFHDVDLLPEDDRNLYTCPAQPRHMSVAVDKFKYKLPYSSIFGGVTAITVPHFKQLNGFSNQFWGWGGEDDDMSRRIRYHRLQISRYKPEIARYTMLRHKQEEKNINRMAVLRTGARRYKTDGLNNLKYELVERVEEALYTNITVHLHKNPYVGING